MEAEGRGGGVKKRMTFRSTRIRVYVDTSVFGGIYDKEFAAATARFFTLVEKGRFQLVISPVVEDELTHAPEQVRKHYEGLKTVAEIVTPTDEARVLERAYIEAGIVSAKYVADALHVATASVSGCGLIVSWNFKHIVHFQKIPMYNGINSAHGYGSIAIHSPLEVIEDGNTGTNSGV